MKWIFVFLSLYLPLSIFGQNKVLPFTEGGDKGFVPESDLKVPYNNILNTPILLTAGTGIGLTNKIRLYDAGGALESVNDNSFGFGVNHSTGAMSISAGLSGYIDFYIQNVKRVTINYDGSTTFKENVLCDNDIYSRTMHASIYVRTFQDANKGYAQMVVGSNDNGGYFEVYRPNLIRTLYIGNPSVNGANNYVAENGSWHNFVGGKVEINSSLEIPNAILPNHAVRLDQAQNATNLTQGVVNDDRLSADIPQKSQNNTFTSANNFTQLNAEIMFLKDAGVASNNKASVVQLGSGELRLKANDAIISKVFINAANELDVTAATAATGKSVNDVVNDNQTFPFVSGDVLNLSASVKAVRMVNSSGTSNTGVTINLSVPTMKSKEQVLIFSGVGLAFNANVVFNAPSGWFIYSGGSIVASRTFVSQATTDAGQGCMYRITYFLTDNTISIMRIKDN